MRRERAQGMRESREAKRGKDFTDDRERDVPGV